MSGYTESSNFPLANPLQATRQGPADAFVTKFTPSGQTVAYSTYLGGSAADMGLGVTANGTGNVFLTGWTEFGQLPHRRAALPADQSRAVGGLYRQDLRRAADAYPDPDRHAADRHADLDPHAHPHGHADLDSHHHPVAHDHADADPHPHADGDRHPADRDPDAHARPRLRPGLECGGRPARPLSRIAPARPDDAWIGGTGQVLHGTAPPGRPDPADEHPVREGRQRGGPAAGHLWGLAPDRAVHWDGTTWTTLAYPSPPPQPGPNPIPYFTAVAATGATDVWFAGQIRTSISEINPYAVLHWDGTAWTWTVGPNWLGPEAAQRALTERTSTRPT